jgi:predicted MFS family arabinose efflux permease
MNNRDVKSVNPIEVTFFLTAFVAATYAFGIYLFSALIPEIRLSLNIDQGVIGVASGASQAGNMVCAVVAGLMVPRLGSMRTIFVFLAVCVLTQVGFFFVGEVYSLVAILFVMGGTGAAVWVAIVVVAQSTIPASHRGRALGIMSSGTSFGLLINGIIVPHIVSAWGWRYVWLVMAAITLALVGVAALRLRMLYSIAEGGVKSEIPEELSITHSLRGPAAIASCVLLFGTALSLVPYQTFLTSLLQESEHWSAANASLAWSAIGTGGIVGGFLLGWIADKVTVKRTLVLVYLILLTAMPVPALFSSHQWLVQIALFLIGMSYFAIFGLIAAYIANAFDAENASIISGITFIAVGFGSMLGNFFDGQIIKHMNSYHALYGGCSAVILLLVATSIFMPSDRCNPVAIKTPA